MNEADLGDVIEAVEPLLPQTWPAALRESWMGQLRRERAPMRFVVEAIALVAANWGHARAAQARISAAEARIIRIRDALSEYLVDGLDTKLSSTKQSEKSAMQVLDKIHHITREA